MPKNPHPDETALLDLSIATRQIVAIFARDHVIDDEERRVLSIVEEARQRLSHSYLARRWFDAYQRNGDNEYTRRLARSADITVISDGAATGTLATLALAPDTEKRPNHGNGPDAA